MNLVLFHDLLGRYKPSPKQTQQALAKLAIEYCKEKEQESVKISQFKFIDYGRIQCEQEKI